jgi:hypothetical protein
MRRLVAVSDGNNSEAWQSGPESELRQAALYRLDHQKEIKRKGGGRSTQNSASFTGGGYKRPATLGYILPSCVLFPF